jgi:Pentapeptide repeats (8 copies)/WD40-like Beta Propeller Repeat
VITSIPLSWSPDSKKIAFVLQDVTSHSSAASTSEYDIYVRRSDGGDLTRLTNTPDTAESTPVWSPDSTKIAFTSTTGISRNNAIYVMNADGSRQEHLTDGFSPAWSPDSKKIAFLRDSGIYVMNADGNCERQLTNHIDSKVGIGDVLDWSPDGEKIAFKSASSGSNDIYVINADGSGRTNLTNSKQSEDYFAWSPARVDASTERTEEAVEDQQSIEVAPQEEALQAYIQQINELLGEKDLRGSEEGSEVRQLARAKTLQVLEGSDPSTKEKAVRFLAEADLVQDVGQRVPIISLSNTDLESANLSGIDLRGADIRAADLGNSDLQKTDLSGADLTDADLTSAYLTDAHLQRANLTNAILHATDLTRADLTGANLTGLYMTTAERREAEQSATGVYLPVENEAKVRAWEATARSSLKDLYASLERCLATIARVEDWDREDSPEDIRDSKIIRCTNSADSDTFFKYYEDDLPPNNVDWNMIQQTKQTPNGLEYTGEALIKVQHKQGGSAFQASTAANGRIERIPRYF